MAKKARVKFETQLLKYLLIATGVPVALLLLVLWYYQASTNLFMLILLTLFCITGYCAITMYHKITFQFRTLSNLLEGMSHGDYSLRGRRHSRDDALGELVDQINNLANTLTEQRFSAMEGQHLLKKVIQHINVAIIAVDEQQQLALLNPAAEQLLNVSSEQMLGKPLANIDAQSLLTISQQQVMELTFANKKGQFQVIRDNYRDHGHQHDLFFITDVNHLLREQERQAWQNLIRVLSHEINNSLTPISSFASTISRLAKKQDLSSDFADNLQQSLTIIGERSSSLKQFIDSYRQLTHLPKPQKQNTNLLALLTKVVAIFKQCNIELDISDDITLALDPVQIEQVLINVIKNADEAMQTCPGNISICASTDEHNAILTIADQGIGIASSHNLFTPFYTTKKQGSGIGLVLSRQIIEAHNGFLSMANRNSERGCQITIQLPIN
ncbi:sensor histidine kinase [Thalassotalea sp. ND16A]|uniref:sensor histidine kinase n=1 Tax=Thalassotalea sp. ND16A TaxID=1535422 RepID=UPI00051A5070|nr:ATP-binding protein [Thalassotalea sp. ND16A]KGJ88034.1 hypothetical protein ND16A_2587 [Thalassotalea sp. ND16A]